MTLVVIAGGVREAFDLPDDADIEELGERLHRGATEGALVVIPRRDQELDAVLFGSHLAGWWFDDAPDRRGLGFS